MKVGRNDPCPCGSGRKYKKCCLPRDRKEERKKAKEELEREKEKYFRERVLREATVLDNFGEDSHRKLASHILEELYTCPEHKLSEDEAFEFERELGDLVFNLVLDEQKANSPWVGWFNSVMEILNAKEAAEFIASDVRESLEFDQTGKSFAILNKIVEWGERKGVASCKES